MIIIIFKLIWIFYFFKVRNKKVRDHTNNIINVIFKYNEKYYIEYYNNITNKRYLSELAPDTNFDCIYNKDLIFIEDDEEFKTIQSLVYEMNKFIWQI